MPTATATPRRRAAPLPPEARRASIIEAILPLLMEQGATVTSRQLAEAAGVSEGTIFNVFDDKEALLIAALETAIDPEPFEQAVSRIEPDLPTRERLIEATALIQRRIVDIWRLISQIEPHCSQRSHRPLADSPALAALLAGEVGLLRIDPVDGARLLRSLTLASTHPLLTPAPRTAADIVELFLHGVQAPEYRP